MAASRILFKGRVRPLSVEDGSPQLSQFYPARRLVALALGVSLGLEDCEPSVEPEDFGKGGVGVGVGVGVESEYDLELRIGGNVGRPGMGRLSLLTVQRVRW